MPFELQPCESVSAGIRRIVDEQLANALEDLGAADAKGADVVVHAARKRFKRVRAVLRLVRAELGEETFASENAAFRDAGGSLSEARDAAVLVETLESLKASADPGAYAAARRVLLARRRAVNERVLAAGNGLEQVAAAAQAARARVAGWTIETDGWDAVRRGIKRAYREGRASFAIARPGAHAELFHDWRKRVKDLWHQLEVVEGVWPDVVKALADECHTLAETLGNEHDLAVLREVLEAEALARAEPVSAVVAAAEARRAELQQAALALGARIYAERPRAFVERLGTYWEAWKSEGPVAPQEPAAPPEHEPASAHVEGGGTGNGAAASDAAASDAVHVAGA